MERFVISNREDLQRLAKARGVRRIEVAMAGLDDEVRALTQQRLAAVLGACGCTEGAVGLLLMLPVVGSLAVAHLLPSGWAGIGLALALVVGGSLSGKLVGLYRAHQALLAEIRVVEARLSALSQ